MLLTDVISHQSAQHLSNVRPLPHGAVVRHRPAAQRTATLTPGKIRRTARRTPRLCDGSYSESCEADKKKCGAYDSEY
eukprot:1314133-Pleurochrysis_carterae.AAC.1